MENNEYYCYNQRGSIMGMVWIEMMKTCAITNHRESSKSGFRVIVCVLNKKQRLTII